MPGFTAEPVNNKRTDLPWSAIAAAAAAAATDDVAPCDSDGSDNQGKESHR